MKITELVAENFKRTRMVKIRPDKNMVFLTGRNKQGKTSILDAIKVALAMPRKSEIPKPIHEGENRAQITIKLDEKNLTVERIFTEGGTLLKVKTEDGASFSSPQALIDKFIGKLTFDPFEFINNEKEQVQMLLGIIDLGIDLDALDEEKKEYYEERTVTNRLITESKAKIDLDNPPTKIKKVSIEELRTELKTAQLKMREIEDCEKAITVTENDIEGIEQDIEGLKKQLAINVTLLKKHKKELSLYEKPDIDAVEKKFDTAEETNQKAKLYEDYVEEKDALKKHESEAESLTGKMKDIDNTKSDAIKNANMPIDGLGFDEDGVTYNGIPLKQISDAEQINVAVAIGVAMNPTLKIILVRNGSLLDSESMKQLSDLADKHDFQVWIEYMDESGEMGFVIEDGMVTKAETFDDQLDGICEKKTEGNR